MGKGLITLRDYSREDIEEILSLARTMARYQRTGTDIAQGKILAALFFEPSTRTRLSFETAMLRLGGKVIGFSSTEGTSVGKGETLADTVRTVAQYADLLVIRHPREGAAQLAAEFSSLPVINAGDGSGNHPTQTLLDLYTMIDHLKDLEGREIALVGDLRYGRTVHSLAPALALFGAKLILVSPQELRIKNEIKEELDRSGVKLRETEDITDALGADVLYITRIQQERFPDATEYAKVAGAYRIDRQLLGKRNPLIMHPLPRVDEIAADVDDLPTAVYFEQAGNGVPVRIALIVRALGLGG